MIQIVFVPCMGYWNGFAERVVKMTRHRNAYTPSPSEMDDVLHSIGILQCASHRHTAVPAKKSIVVKNRLLRLKCRVILFGLRNFQNHSWTIILLDHLNLPLLYPKLQFRFPFSLRDKSVWCWIQHLEREICNRFHFFGRRSVMDSRIVVSHLQYVLKSTYRCIAN